MQSREELKRLTDILLDDSSSWSTWKESLEQIHQLFAGLNHFDVYKQTVPSKDDWLINGCAISPWGAAMCLFDIPRTRLFTKGIIAAIEQLLNEQTARPIQMVDAGCGPYALLSVLAAQYFDSADIKFHLLDIHEGNINASKMLINALDMEDYFGSFNIEDASSFKWKNSQPLHLVITETMLNGLRKEPQVSITLNLNNQLAKNGLLIPQEIKVDFVLVDSFLKNKMEQDAINNSDYNELDYVLFEQSLGNIVTLNKASTKERICHNPITEIKVPDNFNKSSHKLELHTYVTVFDGLMMHHNQSPLTMPITIDKSKAIKAGNLLTFHYNTLQNPGVEYRITE